MPSTNSLKRFLFGKSTNVQPGNRQDEQIIGWNNDQLFIVADSVHTSILPDVPNCSPIYDSSPEVPRRARSPPIGTVQELTPPIDKKTEIIAELALSTNIGLTDVDNWIWHEQRLQMQFFTDNENGENEVVVLPDRDVRRQSGRLNEFAESPDLRPNKSPQPIAKRLSTKSIIHSLKSIRSFRGFKDAEDRKQR